MGTGDWSKITPKPKEEDNPWIKNTGKRVVSKNVTVEYKMAGLDDINKDLVRDLYWEFQGLAGDITHFRFVD